MDSEFHDTVESPSDLEDEEDDRLHPDPQLVILRLKLSMVCRRKAQIRTKRVYIAICIYNLSFLVVN